MTLAANVDVLVIGAGVIGLSAALELRTRGVDTLVVAADTQTRSAVSAASLACINVHSKEPAPYSELHRRAIELHHELDGRVGDGASWLHIVGAEFYGEHHPDWGYVDVDAYSSAYASAFESTGGAIQRGVTVESLTLTEHGVRVVTSCGELRAQRVVLAAGSRTLDLVPTEFRIGRATGTSGAAGFLARVKGISPVSHVVVNDTLSVRPDDHGGQPGFAVQSLAIEAELAAVGKHATVEGVWPALQQRILDAYGLEVADDAVISIDEAERPVSPDGLPLLGPLHPSLYIAVTHSGINLAPLIGAGVARELSGTVEPLFEPFRPHAAPSFVLPSTTQPKEPNVAHRN